ncbi:MAG: ribosome small subunit-dependent GTPase A [Spirochaetia bacterium]|nr:ribosome small subunit-dependent GTPase A [Spirochaetia bacterium]
MTIEKKQNEAIEPHIFRVSRIFGAFYEIYNENNGYNRAVLRGRLRLDKGEERNPIAVGDRVFVEKKQSSDYTILSRLERDNFLIRKSEQGESHVLCANVDNVGIFASLADPETKTGFIDRSLAACYQAGIHPIIIFTKKDLLTDEQLKEKTHFYRGLGYQILSVSYKDPESIQELREFLQAKTTFFVGISGSGKSTLLNSLFGEDIQKVDTISNSSKKGRHTTTNSYLVSIPPSGFIIDSPGIKEWGIFHIPRDVLLASFPELQKSQAICSLNECCNLSDKCEMLKSLEAGNLSSEREISMISMLESLDRIHKVRTGNLKSGRYRAKSK